MGILTPIIGLSAEEYKEFADYLLQERGLMRVGKENISTHFNLGRKRSLEVSLESPLVERYDFKFYFNNKPIDLARVYNDKFGDSKEKSSMFLSSFERTYKVDIEKQIKSFLKEKRLKEKQQEKRDKRQYNKERKREAKRYKKYMKLINKKK